MGTIEKSGRATSDERALGDGEVCSEVEINTFPLIALTIFYFSYNNKVAPSKWIQN